ncbi:MULTISPECIES: T9SS type A sorting domain-containing protein [Chitinophagaceae]
MKAIRPIFLVLLMLLCSKISFSQLTVTSSSSTATKCYGSTDGTITITVSGAINGHYEYQIGSRGPYPVPGWVSVSGNTFSISTLGAGTYPVIVRDRDKITSLVTVQVAVGQPKPISVHVVGINTTCAASSDGKVTATVTNGTAPYTYAWYKNDTLQTSQTTSSMTSLTPGFYNVAVTDSKGCGGQMTDSALKYVPLQLTGFNADVVANGTYSNTNSFTKLDSAGYAFYSNTYGSGGSVPYAGGLPTTSFISASTSDPAKFTLADFSSNNSLRLTGTSSRSFTVGNPNKYTQLYVLATAGDAGTAPTTNWSVNGNTGSFKVTDWATNSGNIALSNLGRVGADGKKSATSGFYLAQYTIPLSTNMTDVSTISFNTAITNTATVNVLAITGGIRAAGVRIDPGPATPAPTVTLTPTSTNYCSGSTSSTAQNWQLVATASGAGPSPTFTWSKSSNNIGMPNTTTTSTDGVTSTNTGTVFGSASYTVSVTVKSAVIGSCAATTSSSVSATFTPVTGMAAPAITLNGVPTNPCPYDSVTYTATPVTPGYAPSYAWTITDANGTSSVSETSTILKLPYSTSGSKTVAIKMTSNIGCGFTTSTVTGSTVTTVNSNAYPAVSIKGWQVPGVNTFRMVINTQNDLGSNPTYQWYKNDIAINGATSSSYDAPNVISTDSYYLLAGSRLACPIPPYVMSNATNMAYMLPVKISSFTLSNIGNLVNVNWVTTMEVNSQSYEIQRSTDASNFVTVGTVASKNAATGGNYTYPDNLPYGGKYYYRIKSVDFDGQYEYSTIQNIDINGTKTDLTISPNPVVSSGLLTGFDAGSTIVILNMNGQVIHSEIANNQSYTVDASRLPSGMYIVRAVNKNGTVKAVKFLKK